VIPLNQETGAPTITRVSGVPIEQNGYWHIEWKNKDGSEEITPYGFNKRTQAESHIKNILSLYNVSL